MCRVAATELSGVAAKMKEKYPLNIIWAGVAQLNEKVEEFSTLFEQTEMYITPNEELFGMLKQKKPGFLSLYGMCNKSQQKIIKEGKAKAKKYANLNENATDPPRFKNSLGATIVVNNSGQVLFYYKDRALGDYPTPDNLTNFIEDYFAKIVDPNYPKIEKTARIENRGL